MKIKIKIITRIENKNGIKNNHKTPMGMRINMKSKYISHKHNNDNENDSTDDNKNKYENKNQNYNNNQSRLYKNEYKLKRK